MATDPPPTTLRIRQPDDWHVHLRDGATLPLTVTHCAQRYGRVLVMPNLSRPVNSRRRALAYRKRILAALPAESLTGPRFTPLMSLYLSDDFEPRLIREAMQPDSWIIGAKLYPAGVTTGSRHGVRKLASLYPALDAMQRHELPLLVHAESTDPQVDVFDREQAFVERELATVVRDFPALRVVLEHVTTKAGVEFVRQHPRRLAATITVHHLLYNRNHMLGQGIRPHLYCAPVLKREEDRLALLEAATGGESCFFLGSDSAPHPRGEKESSCGCAGVYSGHANLELYAEVFEQRGCLERLESFASIHGAAFYRLPPNNHWLSLERIPWQVPDHYLMDGRRPLVPLRAGQTVPWRLVASGQSRGLDTAPNA